LCNIKCLSQIKWLPVVVFDILPGLLWVLGWLLLKYLSRSYICWGVSVGKSKPQFSKVVIGYWYLSFLLIRSQEWNCWTRFR
jgi:hypothetical protein